VRYCQCLYQCGNVLLCDTVSGCTNVAVLCYVILKSACTNVAVLWCVILTMPVQMWQCSVMWYCQRLYQCGSALLCDTVNAVPIMQRFLVRFSVCNSVVLLCMWYSQCLNQCGGALLCDTVSSCTNVAVFFCVTLSVPVPMWQCSIVWYCRSL